MRSLNRRLERLEGSASMPGSAKEHDELLWREVMRRMTTRELKDMQGALKRCIAEDGWAEEDAFIIERAQQLRDEVVSERCNP